MERNARGSRRRGIEPVEGELSEHGFFLPLRQAGEVVELLEQRRIGIFGRQNPPPARDDRIIEGREEGTVVPGIPPTDLHHRPTKFHQLFAEHTDQEIPAKLFDRRLSDLVLGGLFEPRQHLIVE